MRLFPPLALLLALLAVPVLSGCASSKPPVTAQYDGTRNETTYETRRISLGPMFQGSGLSAGTRVYLRAFGDCRGQSCQPREAWLAFVSEGGNTDLRIANRAVTITADGEKHRWQPKDYELQAQNTSPLLGEIVRVSLDLETLRQIAMAEQVSGTLAQDSFRLSERQREPLRQLWERMNS